MWDRIPFSLIKDVKKYISLNTKVTLGPKPSRDGRKEIKKHRQDEQKPRLDELFKRFDEYESQYSVKSKMGVAIQYAKNQEKYIREYLNDGAVEISNNRGESRKTICHGKEIVGVHQHEEWSKDE